MICTLECLRLSVALIPLNKVDTENRENIEQKIHLNFSQMELQK